MARFFFNVYRNGAWSRDEVGQEWPDCGMAFRAAKGIIAAILRDDAPSEEDRAAMLLQVTYDDRSELFRLPFTLGI